MEMSSTCEVRAIGRLLGAEMEPARDQHSATELGALCRLITECERDADGRPMRLVFIGDYIDRGPDSRGVVDYIINLQSRLAVNAICLMGNHEALALSAIDDLNTENWILNGGPGATTSPAHWNYRRRMLRGFVRFGSPSTTVYGSRRFG